MQRVTRPKRSGWALSEAGTGHGAAAASELPWRAITERCLSAEAPVQAALRLVQSSLVLPGPGWGTAGNTRQIPPPNRTTWSASRLLPISCRWLRPAMSFRPRARTYLTPLTCQLLFSSAMLFSFYDLVSSSSSCISEHSTGWLFHFLRKPNTGYASVCQW